MANGLHRLSDRGVKTAKAGKHADGGGLYLYVDSAGSRRWLFIYTFEGKRREMGLGGLNSLPLAMAREESTKLRLMVKSGTDPLNAKHEKCEAAKVAKKEIPSFGSFADQWFETAVAPSLSNPKHADQWRMTLTIYCASMRPKPINAIDTPDILEALDPIWLSKPETASRLRGRIERVLDAAHVAGHRPTGLNPARWKGHLALMLPKPKKLARGHHTAMDWQDIPAFMKALRDRDSLSARALELIILTITRASETLGARWQEIDLDQALWIIPASRMKGRQEHRVPLSPEALTILKAVYPLTQGQAQALIFPSQKSKPLSLTSLEAVRERMGVTGATTHGFRSSFRDWAGEATSAPREVAEGCLAHQIGNAVERAYRRGDALGKRRALLDGWAKYCSNKEPPPANFANIANIG
jgi:integrase